MKVASRFFSLAIFSITFSVAFVNLSRAQEKDEQKPEKENLVATHKQVKVIRPAFPESKDQESEDKQETRTAYPMSAGPLKTFCLAYDGSILAGLSDSKRHALQFLSPDGELKQQVDLQFEPQVISQAPDGNIFIAGPGKLAKVSQSGKILSTADAPWLGDPEELKKEVIAEMKAQYEGIIENYSTTLESMEKRIEKIQADLEEEPTERLEKRLAALEKQRDAQLEQKKMLEEQLEKSSTENIDMLVASRTSSTGIAANSKDLFVCASGKSFSYEVWRMDHDFKSPERVVDSLSGCCGQCDIQCDEENLVVAANTEFAVQFRTRDGKSIDKFGQRGGQDGFGSCCNPMNVKVLPDGDVLTAESSIGWIKRFNREGELEAVIGKAKIGGGCKHVPIGYNAEMDRYYMLYEDRAEICVLDATASLTGPTEDEIAAQQAREGLGQKLPGKWKNSTKSGSGGLFQQLFGSSNANDAPLPASIDFKADGGLKVVGGQFGSMGNRWEAVRQNDGVLVVQIVNDDDSGFNFEVKFQDDETAEIRLMMDVHEFGKATFKRVDSKDADEKSEPKTQDAAAEDPDSGHGDSHADSSAEDDADDSEKSELIPAVRIIRK